jgi:hypothetical protein
MGLPGLSPFRSRLNLTIGTSGFIIVFMKFTRQTLKKLLTSRDLAILHQRWTEEEISFLEENYGSITIDDIAGSLHRSASDIKYMIRILKLDNIRPSWSDEQAQFLKDHKDWPVPKLAKKIGKSKNAIRKKLARI